MKNVLPVVSLPRLLSQETEIILCREKEEEAANSQVNWNLHCIIFTYLSLSVVGDVAKSGEPCDGGRDRARGPGSDLY